MRSENVRAKFRVRVIRVRAIQKWTPLLCLPKRLVNVRAKFRVRAIRVRAIQKYKPFPKFSAPNQEQVENRLAWSKPKSEVWKAWQNLLTLCLSTRFTIVNSNLNIMGQS
jgi:hypothetical protein